MDSFWFGVKFSGQGTRLNNKFSRGFCSETVGGFLGRILEEEAVVVCSVFGSADNNNNIEKIECDKAMPLPVVYQMGIKFLEVNLNSIDRPPDDMPKQVSAFDVLMSVSRKYDQLPDKRKEITAKDRMFNSVVDLFETWNVNFTSQQMKTFGIKVTGDLTNILWSLDPFHEKFARRSLSIPKPFDQFVGYCNWMKNHRREPRLTVTELEKLCDDVFKLSSLPYMLAERVTGFHEKLLDLHDKLVKYQKYLKDMNVRVTNTHSSPTPVRSLHDNWTFEVVEGATDKIPASYDLLLTKLEKHVLYEPIDLLDYQPQDRVKRQHWISNLKLPFPHGKFEYSHGNNLGNLIVIWKQPVPEERNSSEDIRVISEIKDRLPTYATRQMRKEFMELFSKVTKDKPAILRSMYRYLTGHIFSADNSQQQAVDDRVCEFLLNSDDPKLSIDLRKNNGRIKDPKYDAFWKELQIYLDEKTIVHERRHTDSTYMPFAISVADLCSQILKRLPTEAEAPTISWISLNFMPQNPYKDSALKYTGQFKVKHQVQQRLLRAKHVDSEYAFTLYTYLKNFAVTLRDNCIMQCLDDKAIVPVGEPEKPMAAVSRIHHGGLVTGDSNSLLSIDHDYHLCGIVPSVCLVVDIPGNTRESFYHGNVHIGSAMRHATETVKIIRSYSENEVDCPQPVLLRYTDGGPDHRTTYKSVQLAAIAEFVALDLDLFVACRTAPNQSYNNPAERIMSLLNLGLQNVSLARNAMLPGFEMQIKSLNSLKKFRNKGNPSLKTALSESMSEPLNTVKDIFSRLKRKHGSVNVHDASSVDDIASMTGMLKIIEPDINPDSPKALLSPLMKAFMERHCRLRHYSFQIKKCAVENYDTCAYCMLNEPRLPPTEFAKLTFLPDPVKNEVTGEYKEFSSVIGTETTDKDMPSRNEKPTASDRDKKFRSVLVPGKVRSYVICHECGKRRVVYSAARLTAQQRRALELLQDELLYSCGECLFPGGDHQDTVIIREGINCGSNIETQYYAGITQSFDEVCFYCGDTDILLNDEILELRNAFSIVRPICASCFNQGLKPATRNSIKTKRQKKLNSKTPEPFINFTKLDLVCFTSMRKNI